MARRLCKIFFAVVVADALAPQKAPAKVVVDVDVVAETLRVESAMALRGLQSLKPDGPWARAAEVPNRRKFDRVVCELKAERPAELVAILRLLFEEESESARPLTAGEIVENWDSLLAPRCVQDWRADGFSLADIDDEVRSFSPEPLEFRADVLAALRDAAGKGLVSDELTVVTRKESAIGAAVKIDHAGLPTVVRACDSPLDIAGVLIEAADVVDSETRRRRRRESQQQRVYYFTANPSLALLVSSAMSRPVRSFVRTFHCSWSRRWGGLANDVSLPQDNDLGVLGLAPNLYDFRRTIGLPV